MLSFSLSLSHTHTVLPLVLMSSLTMNGETLPTAIKATTAVTVTHGLSNSFTRKSTSPPSAMMSNRRATVQEDLSVHSPTMRVSP